MLPPCLAILWLRDEAQVHLPDPRGVRREDAAGDVEGGGGVGLGVEQGRVLDHGVWLQPGSLGQTTPLQVLRPDLL